MHPKVRYAILRIGTVVTLCQPCGLADPVTEVVYNGAQQLFAQAIEAEVLLGAQAFGEDNADKRISALAVAIQMGATIHDLEEAELCYAPQFGSAKDPLNFAGMIAVNTENGDMPLVHWDEAGEGFLLDVREAKEVAALGVPGALNIPLNELRARLGELPRGRDIHVICRSGTRSYLATRILQQHGFKAKNVPGGVLTRAML